MDIKPYAGTKLVSDKIGILLKNPNRNSKPRWKMSQEGRIKYEENNYRRKNSQGLNETKKKEKRRHRKRVTMQLFGCILRHVNFCWLFIAKSCLCIYILNIFDL